jgi:microcystin-dependent protein
MAQPYLTEIRIFSFNFAPKGWAMCNGQLLPINQNQALFSLLGTVYGGNGQTNFALPDLRGRVPVHHDNSNGIVLGQRAGEEAHTLTQNEMPAHNHPVMASSNAPNANTPLNNSWAGNTGFAPYGSTPNRAMSPTAVSSIGGSQPHNNMSPFLTLNFCISLLGIFPSQN